MSQRSRKYDGPPINEIRKTDQDPARVPPHKKPRTYVLTIEWVQTRRVRKVYKAASKAGREQMRKQIERDIKAKRGLNFYSWYRDDVVTDVKEGPTFTESME
jgi:hypothetical protein